MSATTAPPLIERVSMRFVRPGFAYVSLRLRDVHLHGLEARRGPGGVVLLKPPMREGTDGRLWPIYALQPSALEAAAEAVGALRRQWDEGR